MSRQFKIEMVQDGVPRELGRVQGSHVLIGREPDRDGIAVPNQAISRNHAEFVRLRNHWFFKDLGSTNGSWINGVQCFEGQWKLIRVGDMIQMADAVVYVREVNDGGAASPRITGFPALGGISLLVFSKGEFLDEYPVPEYGRALVLGGSQGDLEIEGQLDEMPSLVIERRSMNVVAFGVAKTLKVLVNDQDLTGSLNLNDRDEIKVAHYFIIFNNPSALSGKPLDAGKAPETGGGGQRWKDWGEEKGAPDLAAYGEGGDSGYSGASQGRGVFGRAQSDEELSAEETVAISSSDVQEKIAGYDMHPSMRYVMEDEEPEISSTLASLDEKIVFLLGIILLLGLTGLMLYWVLT